MKVKELKSLVKLVKGKKPKSLSETKTKIHSEPYLLAKVIRGSEEPKFGKEDEMVVVFPDDLVIISDGDAGEVFQGLSGGLASTMSKLEPLENINLNYLKYFLISNRKLFSDTRTGTAIPHLNKDIFFNLNIPVPSLEKQEKIVERLDRFFNAYSKKIDNNETESKQYQKLINKYIFDIINSGTSKTYILHEVLEKLYAGGDKPSDISIDANHTYKYPIYANAVKNDGLIGYSKIFREDKPAITIAGRGSGTGHVLKRNGPFLPIVRLITAVPDTSIVSIDYLELVFFDMKTKITGSAIPQLTIPNLKNMEIKIPSLEEQAEIVLRVNKLKLVLGRLKDIKKRQNSLLENLKLSYLDKEFSYE